MNASHLKIHVIGGALGAFLLLNSTYSSFAANAAPTATITNPAQGATFAAGSNIKIEATATDSDGQVSKVDFYANATFIGSQGRSGKNPTYFTVTWTNVADGSYALKAVAVDNKGATGTSTLVNITVGSGVPNNPPSVSITGPASGTTYTAPATVDISASAADSDGTVSNVEFFAGSSSLGSDTSSPYGVAWNSVAAGSYNLTARATDNAGASTTSSAVAITVNSSSSSSSSGGGNCGSPAGGPTDNPIAARYGAGAYPWTDNIKWSCVHNINDYAGATALDKYNAARDAATANGGGIVYFPAGTYQMNNDLNLANGVVIRGATPAISDAKQSNYLPPSRLEFPQYVPSLAGSGTPNSTAFKKISTLDTNNDSNIGLVNLDLNRTRFDVQSEDVALQNNRNIVVFGIRSNNAGSPDPGVPASWQNAWQRWCYRFTYNVQLGAYENVLVANSRFHDSTTDSYDQPNYKIRNGTNIITLTDGAKARFDYDNHYIIEVGKGDHSWGPHTPTSAPLLFRNGMVVRDNWIYHTMRVAIMGRGMRLKILDNVIRDLPGKQAVVDPTGTRVVSNSATLENRAIDWGGWDVVISGNDYQVERHLLNGGPYMSVDGEGILIQECCGGTKVNGVTINNNYGPNPTYIGIYKMQDVNNILIHNNTVEDSSLGVYISANTNNGNFKADNVRVLSNTVRGPIGLYADGGQGTGNEIRDNNNPNNNGAIRHSCEANATISNNTGFTVNACQ